MQMVEYLFYIDNYGEAKPVFYMVTCLLYVPVVTGQRIVLLLLTFTITLS